MSGFALEVFPKLARRLSKSASQFPVEDVRKELKNSFLKALENCAGVGLSLFPPAIVWCQRSSLRDQSLTFLLRET